jgi:cytochrome c oxidase subunit 4
VSNLPTWTSGADRKTVPNLAFAATNVVATLLFVCWAYSQLTEGHNWGDDFGLYLQLADNIRHGRPYNELNTLIQVPPGFPMLLAAWKSAFGKSFVALKSMNIAAWVAAAWIACIFARRTLGRLAASCILIAHFLLPAYYYQQQNVLSDLAFAAFVNLLLLRSFLFLSSLRKPGDMSALSFVSVPATLFCALLIRPAGLPFVGALLAASAFDAWRCRRDRKSVLLAVGMAVAVAATCGVYVMAFGASAGAHLTNAVGSTGGSIVSLIAAATHLLHTRALEELTNLGVLFTWYPERGSIGILLFASILVGVVAYLTLTRDFVAPLFLATYVGFILLIPWQQGYRYLLPLVSVILIFIISPAAWLAGFARGVASWWRAVPIALAAACLVFVSAVMVRGLGAIRGVNDDETSDPRTGALIAWLRENTKPGDELCSFKPRAVMYFAHRSTCFLANDMNQEIGSWLRAEGASYAVLITRPAYGYGQLEQRMNTSLAVVEVFRNQDYVVYKLRS